MYDVLYMSNKNCEKKTTFNFIIFNHCQKILVC